MFYCMRLRNFYQKPIGVFSLLSYWLDKKTAFSHGEKQGRLQPHYRARLSCNNLRTLRKNKKICDNTCQSHLARRGTDYRAIFNAR